MIEIKQMTAKLQPPFDGCYRMWYISKETEGLHDYLWPDGTWEKYVSGSIYEPDAYYSCQEEAERVLSRYLADHPEDLHLRPMSPKDS